MRPSRWNAVAFAASLMLMATGLIALPVIRESNGVHFFPDGISGPVFSTGSDIINVKAPNQPFGAVGDGSHDDAPAIQAALTAAKVNGGGRVYLPPGTYKLNSTLVIGDKTELFGAGRASVLKRADIASTNTLGNADCVSTSTIQNKFVLINDKFNCGNTGIVLHDFAIDGSAITIACTSCTGGPTFASVGIDFSAINDGHIYNLYMENMPQDAIFLRNGGGQRFDVHHITINGHDMLWGNGAGINVEMHTGTVGAGNNPGIVSFHDNYIVSKGPDFCDNDLHLACAQDSDCASVGGVCGIGAGASNVESILAFWASDAGGTVPARAIIARNRIETTDNHIAINVFGGQGVEVVDNRIDAFASGTLMSKVYAGIQILASTVTTTRASKDVVVARNLILGGNVANDRRGIFVADDTGAGSSRIAVQGNVVRDRNLRSTLLGAIEVRGVTDSEVAHNIVQNITTQHGIVIGGAGITTSDVRVLGNTITDIITAAKDCLALKATTRAAVFSNTFRSCANAIELQTATVSGTLIGPNAGYNGVTTKLLSTVVDATLVDVDPNIRVDYTNAPSTATFKSGTNAARSATCSVGDTYFCTDCTAGQNFYGCTAVNTFTLQSTTGVGATATHFVMIPDHVISMANSAGQTTVLSVANQPLCVPFVPPVGVTNATKIDFFVSTAAATNCAVCIYDATGSTLITSTGAIDCSTAVNKSVTGLTAYSLVAGTLYRLCYTGDNTTFRLRSQATGPANNTMLNFVNNKVGSAANNGAGGACPATTGALTNANVNPPYVLLSVE